MTTEQTNTTNTLNPIWDYTDDYYFAYIDDIEINIRICENEIGIWIYNYSTDNEILDDYYKSLEELKMILNDILKEDINLPSIEQLQKIER
jgi:hypothetical protein